jgi:hypothetical protein
MRFVHALQQFEAAGLWQHQICQNNIDRGALDDFHRFFGGRNGRRVHAAHLRNFRAGFANGRLVVDDQNVDRGCFAYCDDFFTHHRCSHSKNLPAALIPRNFSCEATCLHTRFQIRTWATGMREQHLTQRVLNMH